MGFVTALMVMFGSVFLYEKSQNISVEVAVGCIGIAILSLVIAIVLAPWQLQLLLLLGVVLSTSLIKTDLV